MPVAEDQMRRRILKKRGKKHWPEKNHQKPWKSNEGDLETWGERGRDCGGDMDGRDEGGHCNG